MHPIAILLVVLTCCVVACGESNPTDTDSDSGQTPVAVDPTTLIVPGRQLGRVPVHARPETLDSLLGAPYRSDSGAGTTVAYYRSPFPGDTTTLTAILTFEPDDNMRKELQTLRTASPMYRDSFGLGVGSARADILRRYALRNPVGRFPDGRDSVVVYPTGTGLTFELDPAGVCRGLSVHATDHRPTGNYRPDYPEMATEEVAPDEARE
ncbi:hypothetical protein CLV84_1639 [Neolewinella xylanilytica]|uniref:Lipoprotein n=1 Tax=Neolewinella xylanilytica TaxID=1514080 RepID=A0A2S6IB40_9BACT|nr:hypothetical protein [Neolewinella xylanilytica]PPK88669.1 hypothetical protein CLV84_1639 [Neolewinella xylanilytica]